MKKQSGHNVDADFMCKLDMKLEYLTFHLIWQDLAPRFSLSSVHHWKRTEHEISLEAAQIQVIVANSSRSMGLWLKAAILKISLADLSLSSQTEVNSTSNCYSCCSICCFEHMIIAVSIDAAACLQIHSTHDLSRSMSAIEEKRIATIELHVLNHWRSPMASYAARVASFNCNNVCADLI